MFSKSVKLLFNELAITHRTQRVPGVLNHRRILFSSIVRSIISITLDLKSAGKYDLCFAYTSRLTVCYRKLVEQELDRPAEQKIITKVFKCEWACPTVNVMKPDDNLRICGDYSLTLKQK